MPASVYPASSTHFDFDIDNVSGFRFPLDSQRIVFDLIGRIIELSDDLVVHALGSEVVGVIG